MPGYHKWVDAMSPTAATRIVLSNLVHDLVNDRVSPEALGDVINEVVAEWDRQHPGDEQPTENDARSAAILLEARLDRAKGVAFCTGTLIDTPIDTPCSLSRITDERALWDF